jgi:hypothetical protein
MRYALERWKQRFWKVIVYDDDGVRLLEVAALYSRDGLYVNGTLSDPRHAQLFVALAYRLADASAGGSQVATVREVVEDTLREV